MVLSCTEPGHLATTFLIRSLASHTIWMFKKKYPFLFLYIVSLLKINDNINNAKNVISF